MVGLCTLTHVHILVNEAIKVEEEKVCQGGFLQGGLSFSTMA